MSFHYPMDHPSQSKHPRLTPQSSPLHQGGPQGGFQWYPAPPPGPRPVQHPPLSSSGLEKPQRQYSYELEGPVQLKPEQGRTSMAENSKECKVTRLNNLCHVMKISCPLYTDWVQLGKNSETTWQANGKFLGEKIEGKGKDKKAVKSDISAKILIKIGEGKFGGDLRTQVLQPLHSSKRTFRGRRGRGNIERSRNKFINKYQIHVLICD